MTVTCPACGIVDPFASTSANQHILCPVCGYQHTPIAEVPDPALDVPPDGYVHTADGYVRIQFSTTLQLNIPPGICCCCLLKGATEWYPTTYRKTKGTTIVREKTWVFPICTACQAWTAAVRTLSAVPDAYPVLPPEDTIPVASADTVTVPPEPALPPEPTYFPPLEVKDLFFAPAEPVRPFDGHRDPLLHAIVLTTISLAGLSALTSVGLVIAGRSTAVLAGLLAAVFGGLTVWVWWYTQEQQRQQKESWDRQEQKRVRTDVENREQQRTQWLPHENERRKQVNAMRRSEWEAQCDKARAEWQAKADRARAEAEERAEDARRRRWAAEQKAAYHRGRLASLESDRQRAEAMRPYEYCKAVPVRYVDWHGAVHTLEVGHAWYADRLVELNQKQWVRC